MNDIPAPVHRLVGRTLHLHVKTIYFNQIKNGEKTYENRLCNDYWAKRLDGQHYDNIIIYNAYKPGEENKIRMPYCGFDILKIKHHHFGPEPVIVYGIKCSPPNVRDHRAGPDDPSKADQTIVAGSGASTC